jgi:glucose-6-phosphate isomerase
MTTPSKRQLWDRFRNFYCEFPSIGLAVDISRVPFPDRFFAEMEPCMQSAFQEMHALEHGAIANADEQRMVGHYWLRNARLAPQPEIAHAIEDTLASIKAFVRDVHGGNLHGRSGPFHNLLVIGIGGSALGPQFVAHALSHPGEDRMKSYFFDNTDPDGIDKVMSCLDGQLGQTLTVVISKSGGTKETRNGMLEAEAAYRHEGLQFAQHAVAITGPGSELDRHAESNGWLKRFPMWDWVGGRTSEMSSVGLLPAALQGFDIDAMLAGARACDDVTRTHTTSANPSALLALMWYHLSGGHGEKAMVVLPYKDRLELLSKYLQQLVMESLGKELDRAGRVVNQGLTVYGNKGSTDQHAYVQQLREGPNNFFATFIEVLRDRNGASIAVEPSVTSGDYLLGFLLGTREALFEKERASITLTVDQVTPFSVGVLIALFERAVGFYASLVNINAYHQPGVEAGKKAAASVLQLQGKILATLAEGSEKGFTVDELGERLEAADQMETIFKICEHLAANPDHGVSKTRGGTAFEARYRKS